MQLTNSLIAVLAVSLLSFSGIIFFPLGKNVLKKIIFALVSLSVGAMFGDAFIHLLPEAFAKASGINVSLAVLFGIVILFIMEKFLRWKHSHGIALKTVETENNHVQTQDMSLGILVNISDGVHNFIDGLIIGASFLASFELGVATTLAVALHEIPQEAANFGLLLHAGYKRAKALLYNFFSALIAFIGVILAFIADVEFLIPLLLAFAAGTFIYIAGSDLVPELKEKRGATSDVVQIFFILLGIGIMSLFLLVE